MALPGLSQADGEGVIGRRDLVFGAACVAAAGAAVALRPHRRMSLLGSDHLTAITPLKVGRWTGEDVTDLVSPDTPDSLASRLYGETMERVYTHGGAGDAVMVLLAHGDSQTEQLQLHRPERCYPAFGYAILDDRPLAVPLTAKVAVPARILTAQGPDRRETIIYWARLGEWLPIDAQEQQLDRVKMALRGYVADGVLARFSTLQAEPARARASLCDFIAEFVSGIAPDKRRVLIGSERALAVRA